MEFIKIEWVPFHEINARHTYLPTGRTAVIKYRILKQSHRPLLHVFRGKNGELFLYKGMEAYSTIKAVRSDQIIPVYITDKHNIKKLDWTLKMLQSCYLEKAYYKIKHEYISLLLQETNHNVKYISAKTGCTKEEILKYKIDDAVPDKYKELAIQHNRQRIVNEICRTPRLRGYKTLLYRAVFQEKNRLTLEKLRIFLKFLDAGYHLSVSSILALPNLNRVVDKDEALKYYWENLDFPDTAILEGIFYYNGEKNSKINVKL
ncbi:hypothetical protein [Ornithinibacillus xuwenensis]|uniref:Uncharacterized protein n=1 Tax=Ornithinibacillus xuwenensis TaxID=3144668 RepID=A0ABU9XNX6_9BACI